jgi:hypothetical protein
MEQGMSQLTYLLDSIDWSSLASLQLCSEKLRTTIIIHEDSIPEDIDDEWFSLPQNVPLSFKLRLFKHLEKKINKFIDELQTEQLQDAQDPNDIDEESIGEYDPSKYF